MTKDDEYLTNYLKLMRELSQAMYLMARELKRKGWKAETIDKVLSEVLYIFALGLDDEDTTKQKDP